MFAGARAPPGAAVGLIRTMAFTHIPANILLAACAFSTNGTVAIALLLVRALFAQMDVPARQSFVMAVVPAEERAAASSVTNVPRSLASAATPLLAGILLSHSTFGWPLLIAGVMKLAYDLTLLWLYRDMPEEIGATTRKPESHPLTGDHLVTYSGDVDEVFKALADPTRRSLLDELYREDGQTLSQLEARFDMTRFGVMKHLKQLEEAGLVVTQRRGREKLHFLNPVPIRLIHDRWVSKYAEPWAAGLSGLKQELEQSDE